MASLFKGKNDLKTLYPNLSKEWHPTKNGKLTPSMVTPGSGKKVWWKCACGHEWEAIISNRTKGQACPFCSGRRLLKGINDFATKYPRIAHEWDFEKNHPLTPDEIMPNTNVKYWWKCDSGHSWSASPNNRTRGKGCPYCTGKIVIPGTNDLAAKNPELADEWCTEKNTLSPTQVFPNSNKKYWWTCKTCGHEWQATANSRSGGSGCPKCAKRYHSSFPEQAIFYYIFKAYPDAVNSYKEIFNNSMELDIFIPSLNIAIEYDGEHAHQGNKIEKDRRKYQICKQNKITLIRIREKECPSSELICDIQILSEYTNGNYSALDDVLLQLSNHLELVSGVDVGRDSLQILELIKSQMKEHSLATDYPNLSKQWNFDRNGKLTPAMFHSGSADKVWWRCEKGHEWQARIYTRTSGVGCPICANKKILSGYNDLSTTDPQLVAEWDYSKNLSLTPSNITRCSKEKVWWVCPNGHHYQMRVSHRTSNHGCPYCSGKRVISGKNDLGTLRPDIAKDWDYEQNGILLPADVSVGSDKKVWWNCRYGHKKLTTISARVKSNGCPVCSKNNYYTKETVELFARDTIVALFDSSYVAFKKVKNTDNFDFINSSAQTGLEVSLVISDNEKQAYEYNINFQREKQNLSREIIKSALFSETGKLKSYAGGPLTEIINLCVNRINEKNEKAKKRIANEQAKNAELALCVVEGGLFDDFTAQTIGKTIEGTVFQRIFLITKSDFFVLEKDGYINHLQR